MSKNEIDNAVSWTRAAGRAAGINVQWLVNRLNKGDVELSDAIHAVMETRLSAWDRLEELKQFIFAQLFDEDGPSPAGERKRLSPFDVPQVILDEFVKSVPNGKNRTAFVADLDIMQVYDSFEVGGNHGTHYTPRLNDNSSLRMFGNANVGNCNRTNLQVAGQLRGTALLTGWWIETIADPAIDMILANSFVRLDIGDRRKAEARARSLYREQQPLLVPVHMRMNLSVEFSCHRYVEPEESIPVYVHLEGWRIPEIY